MAYYNPFQDNKSYYNPYEQAKATPSVISTVSDVAKNMIVFGGLFALGTAATKFASGKIGSIVKSGNFGRATEIAKGLEKPTIGSILRNSSVGKNYTAFKESTGLYKAAQERSSLLSNIAKTDPSKYNLTKITSAFKNPTTFAATLGGVWKRNVITGLGVSFAIDKLSGYYNEMNPEKKAWYDIPGKVGQVGKWFVNNSVYSTAFGLLGPAAKGVASIGMAGARKAFGGSFGKYIEKSLSQVSPTLQHVNGESNLFRDKVIANAVSRHEQTFATKAIKWGQNFSTSVSENFRNLNSSVRAVTTGGAVDAFRKQGSFLSKAKSAFDPIKKALGQIREINARAETIRSERLVDTRTSYSGIRGLQFLQALATDAAQNTTIEKHSLDAQIMSVRESMKSKQTFLEKLLPTAKRVKNKDITSKEWLRDQIKDLRKRYDNKSVGKFVREFMNMDVGDNVFKINNRIVNLDNYSPFGMIRNISAPLLNKKFNDPLTNFKFTLGDITMLNTFITPKPKLDFFIDKNLKQLAEKQSLNIHGITERPVFSTNRELQKQGLNSIDDIMRNSQSTVALYTKGGKWSFFGQNEPMSISTGKDLNYSSRSSRFRYNETRDITIKSLLHKGVSKKEISSLLGGVYSGNNKFVKFMDKMGFQLPTAMDGMLGSLNDLIAGRNREYLTAVKNIFTPGSVTNIQSSLNVLDDIRSHTSQVMSDILGNPEVVDIIQKHGRFGNFKDDLKDILFSEKKLIEKFSEDDLIADGWKYSSDIRRNLETIKAYPSVARQHEQVKTLGGLGSMTSFDKLKVAYVDHITGNNFLNYVSKGNGYKHDLIDAVPDLLNAGLITEKQAGIVKLHAKLSSLQNYSKEQLKTSLQTTDFTGSHLWDEMISNEKKFGLDLEKDLIQFINNNKLRRTNINKYEQRILQRFNDNRPVNNNTPYYSMGRGIEGIGQYLGTSMDRLTEIMGEITPFKKDPVNHFGLLGGAKYLSGTVFKIAAATTAYRIADTAIAANPLFDNSSFDDGITGMTADQLAKARLFSAKVGDTIGLTGAMKYLEGLMPGSTSTIPGLIAGAAMGTFTKTSPFGMIKAMAAGALINRVADPYIPDFSKDYQQVRREYSGEEKVPMMKSPTWLLGSTPWEGSKVAGYRPNWYVRAKSRWEASDTMYGSEFRALIHKPIFPLGFNIGDIIDPYYMERRHYFDRPYPKCLFGSAKVVTVNGIKKIKDIDIGDYVYDINGSVTKVINVLKRKVNYNDTIFSMRVIGQEEDLILTSDHKIPIIRDKKCIFKSQHNKSCTGNDKGICRYCTKKRKDFDISWVEAKDINIGDFLVKKPINPEYLGSTIDISLYVQRPFDIKENKIFIKDKLGRYTGDSFNRYWDIDNDLAYYFGLYLSEGWLGKQRGKYISVNTVHNKKEFDHINRIINNISKKYNLKFSYKDFGTHVNFYIFDYIFSDIIYGLFNCGSATKSVKFFTKELDRKILAGLFYGDGHYDKTHVVLTSINMNLINFATIVLENDFISTCLKKHCDNGHQSYRLSFSYSYLDDYRLLFDINHKNENILTSNKKLHLIYFRNGYLLKRIIKKEEIEYNDFLYDLTVESPTHSFSLYEFIVHNSGRLFSEVPIIGDLLTPIGRILKPEKTMHQEFLQGEWAGTTDGDNPSMASLPPPTYQQNMFMMNQGSGARSLGRITANGGNYTTGGITPWSKVIQGKVFGDVTEAMGLPGFLARTTAEKVFGEPEVIPTLESAGRMASMTRSFYDKNLGGMGSLCLPAYEKILTPSGFIMSEDINIGDIVYDNFYTEQKVVNKFSRLCSENENLYTITMGAGKTTISMTDEHPVAIYKRISCNDNKKRPCIPNYSKKCLTCSKRNSPIHWNWTAAKNISVGDFGVVPLPKIKSFNYIDLAKYSGYVYTDKYIYFRATLEYAKGLELLENNICKTRKDLRNYISDNIAKEVIRCYRYHNFSRVRIPRFISIDEDFCYFMGWWLAEGSSDIKTGNICFTLNINEINIAQKLGEIYKRFSNCSYNIKIIKEKNTCILSLKNKALSLYLKTYGNVYTKQLNDLIYLPDKLAISLLDGLINGDGWINYDLQRGGFTSVSERLVRDIWLLLYRLGVQSTIILNYKEHPNGYYPQGTLRHITTRSCLKFNKDGFINLSKCFSTGVSNGVISNGRVFTTTEYLFIQITDINFVNYSGKPVYDIEVENSHCFIGNYILLHNSEPIRRLLSKEEYNEYQVNPIPNMMPNFLPSQFLTGDPYSSIQNGELRLPGKAYMLTNPDLKQSMPGRASSLGAPLENIVQYFTGLLPPNLKEEYDILETGTLWHSKIQDTLAAEGLLIKAEALVYDVKNDISGHVDAIIRDGQGGKGRRALEIKTISNKGFEKLDAPKDQHIGQLNFYLHQLRFNNGTILYINRDNPSQVKTFELTYNKNRWERDVQKLQRARQIARDMMKDDVSDTLGYSYSWLDRLNILSDVAPMSNEFKEAKQIVMAQIKAGQFTQKDIDKYHRILKQQKARARSYELYPLRFKGKVMSPDSESNIQSINENIKASSEYTLPERLIGSAWETFTNSSNPAVNKFWAFKDPLEHYKEKKLYGREYTPWDEPYRSWIDPYIRTSLSKTSTVGGGVSWGTTGYVFGGEFGAFAGSILGAMYGTVNGLFRSASNSAYIPSEVKNQRRINEYFDKLKYERSNMMSSLTMGNVRNEFLAQRSATMYAFNNESDPSVGNLFRAASPSEKPYLQSWINTTDSGERNEILKLVPNDLGSALKKVWGKNDGKTFTRNRIDNISSDMSGNQQNFNFDASLMDPRINVDDIKLKAIEDYGYNCHDFGLGWNEQMLRIKESELNIPKSNLNDDIPYTPNLSSTQIRGQIYELLHQSGIKCNVNVYINNMDGPNVVNLTVRRDRSLVAINALRNRRKYGV